VVVDLHAPVPASPAAATLPCRSGDGKLYYRSRGVSSFVFSDQVTSGQKSYGPAGVVVALITFLVRFGVCLHAGAVFGRTWNERQGERVSLDYRSG
jgi:hypothetical protein